MRILIARTDRIGDVMISTPVARTVRETFPDAKVFFCVQPDAREILQENSYVNEIIVCDRCGRHKNLLGIVKLAMSLRRYRFDLALILHPTTRIHLACFLAGIPKRVGFDKKLGCLLTERVEHVKQKGEKHELEYTFDVLRKAGITGINSELYFPVSKDTEKEVKTILSDNGIADSGDIVVFHPGASCPSKRWHIEKFSELASRIRTQLKVSIVIVGGKADSEFGAQLKKLAGDEIVDLTGKTNLKLLAGVLKRSRLFISNDSGPVHVSVAVGTTVIAIFGRSDPGLSPKRWGPLGKDDVVFHKDAGCAICLAHKCDKNFKCLEIICVDEVFRAAENVLRR